MYTLCHGEIKLNKRLCLLREFCPCIFDQSPFFQHSFVVRALGKIFSGTLLWGAKFILYTLWIRMELNHMIYLKCQLETIMALKLFQMARKWYSWQLVAKRLWRRKNPLFSNHKWNTVISLTPSQMVFQGGAKATGWQVIGKHMVHGSRRSE